MEVQPDQDQLQTTTGNNIDQTHIVKGKRTKRQRSSAAATTTLQSPVFIPVTTSSSSCVGNGDDDHQSPTTSGFSTEEEEDMAKCLILLANGYGGGGGGGGGGGLKIHEQELDDEIPHPKFAATEKFHSRKFTETGKATGFYVYECKTCNRCFPSFQALGGHRASHKKPRAEDYQTNNNDEAQFLPLQIGNNHRNTTSISLFGSSNHHNKSNKIHECSICGTEFSSGQALGGHMRRHRSSTATAMSMNSIIRPIVAQEQPKMKLQQRNVLSLDLNLPAPIEEERESKFSFGSSKQSNLVFSAPALVDCHY